jgi:transcriptional regulator with GAF, ATPase, and Fis domain
MSTRQPEAGVTQPNEPQSAAKTTRWGLEFVYPRNLVGTAVELCHGLTFGRDATLAAGESNRAGPPAAHVCVPHPTVSRRHAGVQNGFGVPFLSDLGSSNGTRVNGVNLSAPTALVAQSVVRFGDTLAVVDERVSEEARALQSSLPGSGSAVVRVRDLLMRAAPQPVPVLILGETGTGKEWLAADVHRLSGRAGPYLKLSCAELSPQLIESQLFGHERGAFTGADARHSGLFVAAHEGTLFLDEVGELPLDSQAKLLRVLQEGEVRPVGSVRTQRVDVRVVCATNRELARAVEAGSFRRDLYARLSVFELELPPLRERRQDILAWADHFCERAGYELGTIHFQPVVAERLALYAWPDNLRGLDRLVQRLLSLGQPVTVGMQMLREVMPELCEELASSPPPAAAVGATILSSVPALPGHGSRPPAETATAAPAASSPPTREEFLAVYEALGRNVRAVSKHFARDRRQIYRWLESFGIER